VTDRHRDPKVPARLSAEDLEAGREVLGTGGRTIQDFVVACFRLLRTNPRALLALLDGHWPTEAEKQRKRGRPPKDQAEAGDELVSEPFEEPA
jgi:hypothetical protein